MDCDSRKLSMIENNTIQNINCQDHKKHLKDYFQLRQNSKFKNVTSKSTQVNLEPRISEDDITTEIPTESFWKVIAEKRRVALDEALVENKKLWLLHEKLTQENRCNKQLLEEANSFIDVFKELAQDIANDTGIDVGNDSA